MNIADIANLINNSPFTFTPAKIFEDTITDPKLKKMNDVIVELARNIEKQEIPFNNLISSLIIAIQDPTTAAYLNQQIISDPKRLQFMESLQIFLQNPTKLLIIPPNKMITNGGVMNKRKYKSKKYKRARKSKKTKRSRRSKKGRKGRKSRKDRKSRKSQKVK